MTKAQEIYRKQLLTRIHTHPQYKIIKENEAWSEWLELRFGVSSSKELSIKELNIVIDILNQRCNDEIDIKPDYAGRNILNPAKITAKQIEKIKVLASKLGWDDARLMKFINRQCKALLLYSSYLNKLSKKQATSVITGLNAVLKDKAKA
ncbi:phage protein GemA/Gp16 family protein [Campylobacter gastrosuis]|uniref:Regulatory protein GemA n=1 Tax=Campylobacter gastrosuis TaxID=2974576 RepID=A0ABT7HMM4_9BACT|nr:phage protein GemA/Gp16 family protein [Campylobacter gastrosuis]MDL0088149.1 regulatory protein GemA [Campylobacter gastrosuis]